MTITEEQRYVSLVELPMVSNCCVISKTARGAMDGERKTKKEMDLKIPSSAISKTGQRWTWRLTEGKHGMNKSESQQRR